MNTFRNNVFLTGIAGSDPRIVNFSETKRVAKLSMAINESFKNKTGVSVKQTQWFQLVCWNKKVELVENVLFKGSRFSIEGRLTTNSYIDKKGIKRYITEIIVYKLELIEPELNEF